MTSAESAHLIARAPMHGVQLADMFAGARATGGTTRCRAELARADSSSSYEVSDAALKALDTVSRRREGRDRLRGRRGKRASPPWCARPANGRASISLFDRDRSAMRIKPLGTIDDGLGAVSGVAMYKRHVFAVSDARRLDVISIEDPARPRQSVAGSRR